MYKAIKNEKIIAISETDDKFKCLFKDTVEKDTEHTCADYKEYNDEYILKQDIPAPTEEEQRQKRQEAYTLEVDPITCHIQRLTDEVMTPEIEQEIAELKQERADKVEEIKQRYPYPVGE